MLGDSDINFSLPNSVKQHIQEIKIFIVENVRSARRFIIKADKEKRIPKKEPILIMGFGVGYSLSGGIFIFD